jgi:hypothetical protein
MGVLQHSLAKLDELLGAPDSDVGMQPCSSNSSNWMGQVDWQGH